MEDTKPRKKVWKPKARTGCITCRIRRTKCDEKRPECNKCTSTGRKCDGYKERSPNKSRRPSPISLGPTLSPAANEDGALYLDFFLKYTVNEVAGLSGSNFWQRDVLQASHTHSAIRYGIKGLAALHRTYVAGKTPTIPESTSHEDMQYALRLCNRAIQEVTRFPCRTKADKITMTTACIIFTCFASLEGHTPAALRHFKSGLALLKEVEIHGSGQGETEKSSVHPVSVQSLRATLLDLNILARGISDYEDSDLGDPKQSGSVIIPPRAFISLNQACTYIEATTDKLLGFLQTTGMNDQDPGERVAIEQEYKRLVFQYESGRKLLDDFLARQTVPLTKQEHITLKLLKLRNCQVQLYTKAATLAPRDAETLWDVFESLFEEMLQLTEELLETTSEIISRSPAPEYNIYKGSTLNQWASGGGPPGSGCLTARPVFSSTFGLATALWTVASRSRDPFMRRKAVALLMSYPRIEGFVDSGLMGRIAWEAMMMEESAYVAEHGLSNADCPFTITAAADIMDDFRIRDSTLTYTGLRTADVEFQSMRQWRRGEPGIVKTFRW